jgi:hypothetical protein
MKNFLKAIILGTSLVSVSCGFEHLYDYNGKIGNESIRTFNSGFTIFDLYVTKEDGRKIDYHDWIMNKKLDSVTITKNEKSITYENDEIGKEALKVAQKQYEYYLEKILEAKKKKALEDIQ